MDSTVVESDEWEVRIIFKYKWNNLGFPQDSRTRSNFINEVPDIEYFITTVGETRSISHLINLLGFGEIAENFAILYDCVFPRHVEYVEVTAKDEPQTIYSRDDLENPDLWLRQIWGTKIADGHTLGRAEKGEAVPTIIVIVNSVQIERRIRRLLYAREVQASYG